MELLNALGTTLYTLHELSHLLTEVTIWYVPRFYLP